MLLLPTIIGPVTLQRKLGTGSIAETYQGLHGGFRGRQVVVRRVLPWVVRDPRRKAELEARVRFLLRLRHPLLVQAIDWVVEGEEHLLVEERIEGTSLDRILGHCRQQGTAPPPQVILNLAVQACNALDALHGRMTEDGAPALHLGLKPGSIYVTSEGQVRLGSYGLARSPVMGNLTAPVPARLEYLAPEQTFPASSASDTQVSTATDIFALATILHELATLTPLFRGEGSLQTIARVRAGLDARGSNVTPALAAFRERLHARLPGLAGALEGALKPTPAHRIQRTPPLRDALRALMAGYSFTSILDDTRGFLDPLLETAHVPAPEVQDPNDDTEVDAPRPPSPAPTVPLPRHDDATIPAEDVPEEYAPARVEESGMDDDFTLPYAEGGTPEADGTPDDDDDTPIVPVDAPWVPPPTLAAQPPPTPGDDAWPSLPRREAPRVPRSPALRLAAPAGLSALGRAVPEMDRPPVSPAPTLPLPAVAPPPHPPEEEPAVIPAPPRRNWTLWAVAALLAITVVTVGTARHVVSGTQDGPVANAPSVIPPILPDATTLASALKGLTDGAHLSDAQIGAAARGVLAPADVTALLTPTLLTAPGRAGRALVLVDAQRKGDTSTEAAVLAELLRLPEKKIEPEWWIAEGRLRANRQDWPGAMDALFSIPMAAGLDPWSRAGLLEVRAAAAMGTAKDDAARASARANWTALAEFARQNNLPDVAARAEARSR